MLVVQRGRDVEDTVRGHALVLLSCEAGALPACRWLYQQKLAGVGPAVTLPYWYTPPRGEPAERAE
jgi:hypothetical protein